MAGITKQQGANFWGNSYKLKDRYDRIFDIVFPTNEGLVVRCGDADSFTIPYQNIGRFFFILCRPLSDLTKEIKGIGVPIVELFKLAGFGTWDYDTYNYFQNVKIEIEEDRLRGKDKDIEFIFMMEGGSFITIKTEPRYEHCKVAHQEALFAWLDKHHFLRGVSEDCLIYITE